MDSAKQLRDLSKVYMEAVYGGGKKEEKKDTRLVVTAADKKANTKAYQNYKAGNKAYKAADHLGEGIKGEDNETRKAAALERKAGVKTRLSPSEGRKNVANMLYKIRNAKSNPQNESVSEDKKYGYDKDGNSLNPVDIEKREKEDDDLAGAPNGKGKKKAKKWWDDDGDGKGYEKGEVDGKFPDKDGSKKKKGVKEQNELVSKEVKDLQKAAKTGKGKYVAKADKVKGVGESVESDEYIEIVREIKSAETQADIKRWKSLEESGKFTAEEIDTIMEADIADILARLEKKRISKGGDPEESPLPAMRKYHADKKKKVKKEEFELDEAERDLGDRLHRKRKLYDRTVKKAMDFARREGEAAGHARYRMGQLDTEMDKVKDKMKKEK